MISENGFENLQWFMGIVEDNEDPTNHGRVKVRCFGIHPPYEVGDGINQHVATHELPWAVVLQGAYGSVSSTPRVTDWVFGFFADGRDAQHPFIIGTIPGQSLSSMWNSGEADASSYVKPSYEAAMFYGSPPLHSAITGENLHETQLPLQNATVKQGVPYAYDGAPEEQTEEGGWSEPPILVSGGGNRTSVFNSPYGESFMEVSGNENGESILISHSSGSAVYIDSAGNIVIKSLSDDYSVCEGDRREYTGGRKDIAIEGKYTINVMNGDCTLEVQGDLNHVVHGDYNLNVAGRFAASIGMGAEMSSSRMSFVARDEFINISAPSQDGKIRMWANGEFSIASQKNMWLTSNKSDIDISAEKNVSILSGDDINIFSEKALKIKGKSIDLLSSDTLKITSDDSMHLKSGGSLIAQSSGSGTITSGGKLNLAGSSVEILSSSFIAPEPTENPFPGSAAQASSALTAAKAKATPEEIFYPKINPPVGKGFAYSGNQGGILSYGPAFSRVGGLGIGAVLIEDFEGDQSPPVEWKEEALLDDD